jgi:CYTH domain-containing protein
VDVYVSGLITAEIEVTEDKIDWLTNFIPEDWMSKDITGNIKYKNITLAYENF